MSLIDCKRCKLGCLGTLLCARGEAQRAAHVPVKQYTVRSGGRGHGRGHGRGRPQRRALSSISPTDHAGTRQRPIGDGRAQAEPRPRSLSSLLLNSVDTPGRPRRPTSPWPPCPRGHGDAVGASRAGRAGDQGCRPSHGSTPASRGAGRPGAYMLRNSTGQSGSLLSPRWPPCRPPRWPGGPRSRAPSPRSASERPGALPGAVPRAVPRTTRGAPLRRLLLHEA